LGPAGTVHSTIEDWAKFLRLQFLTKDPVILDTATFDALATPNVNSYGAGWFAVYRSWAPGVILNHSGSNTMWYCIVWLSKETGKAYVAAVNSAAPNTGRQLDSVIGFLIGVSPARSALMS